MKTYLMILLITTCEIIPVKAQQDSLIYDKDSGNYIIQYWRENPETGQPDSLIRLIFVPATKVNPIVTAGVSFLPDSNLYIYRYVIKNGADSKQNLFSFLLEFGIGVDANDRSTNGWHGGRHMHGNSKINKYDWFADQGLQPTWHTGGFALVSLGVPGIGYAYFQGKAPITGYPAEPPAELDTQIARLEIFPANHVKRVTVVPIALSDPFAPLAFLDTLLSYIRQSISLGWLKNTRDNDCDGDERPEDGVSTNLEKRLAKVRSELVKGDTLKASRELEKFIKKVERESRHIDVMASEAYTLLKYNAEYLVSRIIALPPRLTSTIVQQIDSLKIEVQNQSKKKNLGGVMLTTSLTLLCDQAKRELQKPIPSGKDSVEAAIYIALFQLLVDEIYDVTTSLLEKSKRLPPLYVKDETYIRLHYRAKYILEMLPSISSIDFSTERSQKLDKQLMNEMERMKEEMK